MLKVAAEVNAAASVDLAVEIASDRTKSDAVRGAVERVRYAIAGEFKIDRPENMGEVGRVEPVEAETPYIGLHHYVVVTADKTGVSHLEEELVVRRGGKMIGSARFGEAGVGMGETFSLEVLATSRQERELRDEWPKRPDGAQVSNAVRVRRTRQ
jgi:hypothetical protein